MSRSPLVLLMLVMTLMLVACGPAPAITEPASPPAPVASTTSAGRLSVFAAASLTNAFEALGSAFAAANPGVEIVFNFAGSQQLAAQINEGAPADVFASANLSQLQVALEGGRIERGAEQIFARNRLVVITPSDNPAGLKEPGDLARPGLRLILADAAVPVGQYSLDFLAKASALPAYTASFSPTVRANVVSYEDNVRAVLTKVALGEGDAGIVYATDAALKPDQITTIAIPEELNTSVDYPIAPLNDSPNAALADAFIAYLLAPAGQAVLAHYGFSSPTTVGAGTLHVAQAVP